MNKWGLLNLLLVGVLGLLVLLLVAMHTNPDKRNPYWISGMVTSPAPADFSVNPNFPDGQTLQTPPDGTLAQGEQPYPYAGGFEGAVAAGKALKNPLHAEDPEVLVRGKVLFERNCMPCHGAEARGDGLVTASKRQGGFPPPPSLLAAHAKGLPDGYIYNYISRGGLLMPSYGAQIRPVDRWKVICWVRYMQKSFPENPPKAGSAEADAEAALVPSTTPGYGYTGAPLDNEILAGEALHQAELNNLENPSPAEATPVVVAEAGGSAASAPTDPWGKALVLIKQNDCLSCHAVEHKVVGPAYEDVAKRYYNKQPGIIPILVAKVKNGGSGNWGAIPMAAHPNVSNADLTIMVEGILSLAKKKGDKDSMVPRAPSMKQVLALVHSGVPVHCPAMGDQAINGPSYLDERVPAQAQVSRVGASDDLADLDDSSASVVKETK